MKNDTLSSRCAFACFLLFALAAFAPARGISGEAGGAAKLRIVASLFPQYDFAKQIGGDKVAVTMLLPPATDAHAFDPKPSDLVGIAEADIFAYTGADMEPWAERLIEALKGTGKALPVDVAAGMELLNVERHDEEEDGEHHEEEEDHHDEEEEHEEEHGDEHGHVHLLDPHVWLDPVLAVTMVDNLLAGMQQADPENAGYYAANAASLKEELRKIDAECRDMVAAAKRRVLVFGGRFAFVYFCRRYGLEHVGAYDSCGAGEEPSVKRIVEVTEYVRTNRIPVIFYEEFVEPRISRTIADATGCNIAMAHSLHNLTADEYAAGVTFVEMMRRNIGTLAEGLR